MARMKQVVCLQALKEKYGDDKQKLNAAMMEMYRTEKINPLAAACRWWCRSRCSSRCTVLLASVEMRGAPWILWVHDRRSATRSSFCPPS